MAIEVLLVDDHDIVRQGIKSVLSKESDIKVIAEACDGREALRLAKEKSPDVIVMDITLPFLNGLEATYKIIKHNKSAKVLILSMHENRAFAEKALSYGVKGYILKESAADEIIPAIRDVNNGKLFLSKKISSLVIQDYVKSIKVKSSSLLTPREREILQLITEGLNNKDIAKRLGLALKTVLVHRNNIMNKLGFHNQAQLIKFAIKEGISGV